MAETAPLWVSLHPCGLYLVNNKLEADVSPDTEMAYVYEGGLDAVVNTMVFLHRMSGVVFLSPIL